VVHVYPDGRAFEVEFTTLDGRTAAVATVDALALRPVLVTRSRIRGSSRARAELTTNQAGWPSRTPPIKITRPHENCYAQTQASLLGSERLSGIKATGAKSRPPSGGGQPHS